MNEVILLIYKLYEGEEREQVLSMLKEDLRGCCWCCLAPIEGRDCESCKGEGN